MTIATKYIALLTAAATVGAGAVIIAISARDDQQGRQATVAERGREVMPFDLERSTHRFDKTADGRMQTVVSDDRDSKQIALIRAHLRKEARLFRQGVFTDPVTIHGPTMPGVAEMRSGSAQIDISYRDIATGGRLRYQQTTRSSLTPSTTGSMRRPATTARTPRKTGDR